MGMRMAIGRCCCCELYEDAFTRSDSDDPGGFWRELAGDFDIASNKISTTSDHGVLVFEPTPELPNQVRVGVTVNAPTDCDEIRLYCDIVDPDDDDGSGIPNDCHWAEYRFLQAIGGTCPRRIRVYRRAAGVDELLAESLGVGISDTHMVTGTPSQLFLCVKENAVTAFRAFGGGAHTTGAYTTPHGGKFVALGTGAIGAAAVTFDDFATWVSRWFALTCPLCHQPCLHAQERAIAREYQVVVAGVTDGTGGFGTGPTYNGTFLLPNRCWISGSALDVAPCCGARLQTDINTPFSGSPDYVHLYVSDGTFFGGTFNVDVAGSRFAVTNSPQTAIVTGLSLPRTFMFSDVYANTSAATVTVTALP